MSNAEAYVIAGGVDAALVEFHQATKADPAKKDAWVRIAQLEFDRSNYPSAIIAAQEVLKRDPADNVADSVITVSGFRMAQQSLQRLQASGAIKSDAAQDEARTLMAALRDSIGEEDAPPSESESSRRATGAARRPSNGRAQQRPAQTRPAQAPRPASSNTQQQRQSQKVSPRNPFGVIGGN